MAQKLYPCYRCGGSGNIRGFSHVLGGVCFKCGGTGKQKTKPSIGVLWAVLDSSSSHAYNIKARTANEAIKKAKVTYARASEEFRAEHDMSNAYALLAEEYWTPERVAAVSQLDRKNQEDS